MTSITSTISPVGSWFSGILTWFDKFGETITWGIEMSRRVEDHTTTRGAPSHDELQDIVAKVDAYINAPH